MFPDLIPILNAINYFEEKRAGLLPASLLSFLSQLDPSLASSRRESYVTCEFLYFRIIVAASVIVIVAVMVGSLLRSLYSKVRKLGQNFSDTPVAAAVAGDSPGFDALTMPWSLLNDARNEDKSELIPVSDVTSAEDLQIQEVLFASLLTSRMENRASSSAIQATPTLYMTSTNTTKEVPIPSQSFCEICMENREIWQMFVNSTCSHSFCYDCTGKHIITKIQASASIVTCPGVNCSVMLDSGACRWMIPKDILIRWDESICKSLILESEKVYCPFKDCSAMLVNDSPQVIKETKCPVCQRTFCAWCHVPWHSEFTCNEFLKLNGKKKGGVDLLVEKLAKKKKWRKCPSCKFYVEKNQGCLHITCRCAYEFCYRCGSKWSSKHGSCSAKNG